MTISEGDMLLINDGDSVNVAYVSSRMTIPYLGDCFGVTEITESGERTKIISQEMAIECKREYEEILKGLESPILIHGINNGYQDW